MLSDADELEAAARSKTTQEAQGTDSTTNMPACVFSKSIAREHLSQVMFAWEVKRLNVVSLSESQRVSVTFGHEDCIVSVTLIINLD